jgi:hypothetical protein
MTMKRQEEKSGGAQAFVRCAAVVAGMAGMGLIVLGLGSVALGVIK